MLKQKYWNYAKNFQYIKKRYNVVTQSFKGRQKSRKYALQGLYSWAFNDNNLADIEAHLLMSRNPKKIDMEYLRKLLHDIPAKIDELDDNIKLFLDRPLDTLDLIELMILRIGTFELIYCDDVPYKVIINEELELAKVFGANKSHEFINGVLDKLAAKLRSE